MMGGLWEGGSRGARAVHVFVSGSVNERNEEREGDGSEANRLEEGRETGYVPVLS